jgi:hypothetical protein
MNQQLIQMKLIESILDYQTMRNRTMSVAVGIVATPVLAQEKKAAADPAKRQVFFGEQHLHTVNSPDAFAMGTRNTVDDAYNFARGMAVKKNTTGEMIPKKIFGRIMNTDLLKKPDFYPGLQQHLQ